MLCLSYGVISGQVLINICKIRCRYGGEHRAPELQKEAVYGLTELNRCGSPPGRVHKHPRRELYVLAGQLNVWIRW